MGPMQDLVLDMGAYRYMPLAQPLITDIIENLLDLPNRLYQVILSLTGSAVLDYAQSNCDFDSDCVISTAHDSYQLHRPLE